MHFEGANYTGRAGPISTATEPRMVSLELQPIQHESGLWREMTMTTPCRHPSCCSMLKLSRRGRRRLRLPWHAELRVPWEVEPSSFLMPRWVFWSWLQWAYKAPMPEALLPSHPQPVGSPTHEPQNVLGGKPQLYTRTSRMPAWHRLPSSPSFEPLASQPPSCCQLVLRSNLSHLEALARNQHVLQKHISQEAATKYC